VDRYEIRDIPLVPPSTQARAQENGKSFPEAGVSKYEASTTFVSEYLAYTHGLTTALWFIA